MSKAASGNIDDDAQRPHLIHATTIALDDRAVLITGPSGSGKSDLALRCLAIAPNGLIAAAAKLVADDQTLLSVDGGRLIASAPPSIRGRMEVRGVGIVDVPTTAEATVALIVELVGAPPERLPPEPLPTVNLFGFAVAKLFLMPFEASAPLKVLLALQRTHRLTKFGQVGTNCS